MSLCAHTYAKYVGTDAPHLAGLTGQIMHIHADVCDVLFPGIGISYGIAPLDLVGVPAPLVPQPGNWVTISGFAYPWTAPDGQQTVCVAYGRGVTVHEVLVPGQGDFIEVDSKILAVNANGQVSGDVKARYRDARLLPPAEAKAHRENLERKERNRRTREDVLRDFTPEELAELAEMIKAKR